MAAATKGIMAAFTSLLSAKSSHLRSCSKLSNMIEPPKCGRRWMNRRSLSRSVRQHWALVVLLDGGQFQKRFGTQIAHQAENLAAASHACRGRVPAGRCREALVVVQ